MSSRRTMVRSGDVAHPFNTPPEEICRVDSPPRTAPRGLGTHVLPEAAPGQGRMTCHVEIMLAPFIEILIAPCIPARATATSRCGPCPCHRFPFFLSIGPVHRLVIVVRRCKAPGDSLECHAVHCAPAARRTLVILRRIEVQTFAELGGKASSWRAAGDLSGRTHRWR